MTQHVRKMANAGLLLAATAAVIASVPGLRSTALGGAAAAAPAAPGCAAMPGITLPPGFCATVFADHLGHARHMVVAADGTLYVNTWSGRYYQKAPPPPGGFVVALKDGNGDGRADKQVRFGPTVAEGNAGGVGIALYRDHLYVETNDRIVRYALTGTTGVPAGAPETILSGMPLTGDHPMHGFAIDAKGDLFVNMGSATNSCETHNRQPGSKGIEPCVEQRTRAGIWRYDANRPGQHFSPAERYATGIRNTGGLSFDAQGRLFAVQHGRDQLSENWPKLYRPAQGPELPAEELVEVVAGGDYGWPHCYYDGFQKRLVLAPEYGGDGGRAVGVCAARKAPVAAFPAHWAPNDVLIYRGTQFPPAYRGGAFIAFHGSWNRAPAPQGGYNVTFQPLAAGHATGRYILFADGFAGAFKEPGRAETRPTGFAEAPDGSLYISDDVQGRIWHVTYHGPADAPLASAPAASTASTARGAVPPEGTHADAGRATPKLAPPPGFTADQVALGERIYHGEVRGGTCSGCHASDASGTPVGPKLTGPDYIWGDGSVAALAKTIREGVAKAKKGNGAMPARGGAPLSDGDVDAVAAYLWALAHQK